MLMKGGKRGGREPMNLMLISHNTPQLAASYINPAGWLAGITQLKMFGRESCDWMTEDRDFFLYSSFESWVRSVYICGCPGG